MKIYAGGFARFFLGDWDGAASVSDEDVDDEDAGDEATPDEVRAYFEAFRDASPARWSEALDGPDVARSVDESQFGALLTIAARAAVQDKRLTPISEHRDWFEDPAVVQIQDAVDDFTSAHHLVKADTWLPADFPHVTETEVPGRDVIIGSLAQLSVALAEMHRILTMPNEVTRKLSPRLVADAKAAHEVVAEVVAWATKHGMPVLIEP